MEDGSMFWRATESIAEMIEQKTQEAEEAALAASRRLLAADPLSIDALQLKGLALHFLGR